MSDTSCTLTLGPCNRTVHDARCAIRNEYNVKGLPELRKPLNLGQRILFYLNTFLPLKKKNLCLTSKKMVPKCLLQSGSTVYSWFQIYWSAYVSDHLVWSLVVWVTEVPLYIACKQNDYPYLPF